MSQKIPSITGQQERRNITRRKPGTKRFVLARVMIDVFSYLWGYQNFQTVITFTLAGVKRQGDEAFLL